LFFREDIFLPEGFVEQSIVKGDVLDLGCGRGSVGAFLRTIDPEIRLVGVDTVTNYQGENAYNVYAEIRTSDAEDELNSIFPKGAEKYDLIVSCGLPPKILSRLLTNENLLKVLKPKGAVLFIFDYWDNKNNVLSSLIAKGFQFRGGKHFVDQYILFWQDKSND